MIQFKAILHPTDFSECAAAAAKYAYTLASRLDCEVHLLHVVPEILPVIIPEYGTALWPEEFLQEAEKGAQSSLELLPSEKWMQQVNTVRAVRRGPAAVKIIDYADENDVDLIILGTHGRSGLAHVLMGSVAERIVRKSNRPVMTVRAPARPKA
jgi:nucleotide-binding universal stress UspA family protein